MNPRDGRGGGGRTGGRTKDGLGATSGATGAEMRKTFVTKTTAGRESRIRYKPTAQMSSNETGEEYRAEGTDWEESADKTVK